MAVVRYGPDQPMTGKVWVIRNQNQCSIELKSRCRATKAAPALRYRYQSRLSSLFRSYSPFCPLEKSLTIPKL
jgi:hypothetical protein